MDKPQAVALRTEAVDAQRTGPIDWRVLFAIVIFIAAVLRFYHLGTESLWIDEGFSIRDATNPFTYAKASKPLYYWLLTPWYQLGSSEWFLRLPAVIFGIATVAMVFLVGRLIWGNRAAFLAALLMAVSPLQVDHSQEVRMYSLLTLEALLSVYFLILALRTWKFQYMAASAFCAWLAILTQPMACMLLLVENVAVLDAYIRKRMPLMPWIITQVAVVLGWMPWVKYVFGFGAQFEQSWAAYLDKASIIQMPQVWSEFGIGQWDAEHTKLGVVLQTYAYGTLIAALAFAWIERRHAETRFIVIWFLLPGLALLTLSVIKINALIPRYLVFTAPALLLLLGAAWASIRNRRLFAAFGLIVFLIPVAKLERYYANTGRAEWRPATAYIMKHEQPTDFIGIYRSGNRYVFNHYYHGRASWAPIGPDSLLKWQLIGWNEKRALDLIASMPDAPRKWLILSRIPLAGEMMVDKVLRRNYRVLDSKEYVQLKVYLIDERK